MATAPDVDRIEKKAGDQISAFNELVFPEGQPADTAPPAKRARRDPAELDVKALAAEQKVKEQSHSSLASHRVLNSPRGEQKWSVIETEIHRGVREVSSMTPWVGHFAWMRL